MRRDKKCTMGTNLTNEETYLSIKAQELGCSYSDCHKSQHGGYVSTVTEVSSQFSVLYKRFHESMKVAGTKLR